MRPTSRHVRRFGNSLGIPLLLWALLGGAASAAEGDPFTQVSIGTHLVCATHASGRVACFSDDDPVLRRVDGVDDAVRAVAGRGEPLVCVVRRIGRVTCVARDPALQRALIQPQFGDAVDAFFDESGGLCVVRAHAPITCGHLQRTAPLTTPFPPGTRAVAVGVGFDCTLDDKGQVACAGSNGRGQLGDGVPPGGEHGRVRVRLSPSVAIAAAIEHGCALHASGRVTCWGTNHEGALGVGRGRPAEADVGRPVEVPGLEGVAQIAVSGWSSCARGRDGRLACWGANSNGALGDGTLEDRYRAVRLALGPAVDVALGNGRGCAALADGRLACWGENARPRPTRIAIDDATALAAAAEATCATRRGGGGSCWGYLGRYQDGAAVALSAPTTMPALAGLTGIALRSDSWEWVACGLRAGDAACWMYPPSSGGEVAQLSARPRRLVPVEVGRPRGVALAGFNSWQVGCASGDAGTVCFFPAAGRAGGLERLAVPSLRGASRLVVRADHSLCGLVDGQVRCVPHRDESGYGGPAVALAGAAAMVELDGRFGRPLCALGRDGAVACWSLDDETVEAPPARALELGGPVSSLALGDDVAFAARRDGSVVRFHPDGEVRLERITGLDDVAEVVAGTRHACARHRAGGVSCWGANPRGQVGDGTGAGVTWIVPEAVAAPRSKR